MHTLNFAFTHSVGVGFSYADYGETVGTTEEAAVNVHAFISIFFETFSQFKGRRLHLSGESYGVSFLVIESPSHRCDHSIMSEVFVCSLGSLLARVRQ